MRAVDLNRLLHRRPFRRFDVHLVNGSVYSIHHPDMAVVSRSTLFLSLQEPAPSPVELYRETTIALRHILRLVPVVEATSPEST